MKIYDTQHRIYVSTTDFIPALRWLQVNRPEFYNQLLDEADKKFQDSSCGTLVEFCKKRRGNLYEVIRGKVSIGGNKKLSLQTATQPVLGEDQQVLNLILVLVS